MAQDDVTAGAGDGEIGYPGLEIYGGYVHEEPLAELSGGKAIRTYREMALNDPLIGAMLFAIRMLIRQADWSIRPASSAPEDEQAAEFLRQCQQDMTHSWAEFIDEALSMLEQGFSAHELVYKRRNGPVGESPSRFADGRIGWKRLPVRVQATIAEWQHDPDGRDITGLWQQAAPSWRRVFIPAERLLLLRPYSHKGNPEGRSILRTAYRPWYFKKRVENFEGIGIERDLAGIPTAGIPAHMMQSNASATDKAVYATFKKLVTQIRNNEQAGLVYPLEYDDRGNKIFEIGLLSSSSRRMFDTNAIIQRYDQRIAMTVLADFILIGHEKTGSFALADSKTAAFALAIGAWLDSIQEALNRQAVPRLFALNPEFRVQALPTFVHGDVEKPDLAELGAYVSSLAGAGVPLIGPEMDAHLKRIAGLPTDDNEER